VRGSVGKWGWYNVYRREGFIPVQLLRLLGNQEFYSIFLYMATGISPVHQRDLVRRSRFPEGLVSEGKADVPRSLMFITPAALELTLRCFVPSFGGLDERP
jgi:hypothetical protein